MSKPLNLSEINIFAPENSGLRNPFSRGLFSFALKTRLSSFSDLFFFGVQRMALRCMDFSFPVFAGFGLVEK